jgi:ABC-type branched-subunit amino acid transport system substrate-binding protein
MQKGVAGAVISAFALLTSTVIGATPASASPGASGTASQGVTATTIRVGIPYVDLAAVRQYGVKLDHGNYPDAYNALIAHINAQGGINGRKLVPFLVAVNPVGTAAAATACTQLAQDDKVFVAFSPQQPDCYLSQYKIPTINGTFQDVSVSAGTPNFTMQAPPLAYDPIQLAMFAHNGLFRGKTVGIFAGQITDQRELEAVQSDLKALHVKVAQSAVDSAPTGDQSATYQDANIIAQKFQSAGVNEVVAVGTGSLVWPEALQAEQSTFNPSWVATNESSIEGAIVGSTTSPTYLKNMVTSSAVLDNYRTWHQAADQQCYQTVRKAYPADKVTQPTNPIMGSDQSFFAIQEACDNLAMFTAIAKAAGKDLTQAAFIKAGYGLRNATLPEAAVPVSFAQGRPYPVGPVYLGHFDATKNSILFSTASS